MSYSDIFAAANDATFQGRCLVAAWTSAQAIKTEDPATPDHQARKDWADRMLADRPNITPRQLAMQVLRNPVIAAAPAAADDGALQYQVNAIIGDLIAIG